MVAGSGRIHNMLGVPLKSKKSNIFKAQIKREIGCKSRKVFLRIALNLDALSQQFSTDGTYTTVGMPGNVGCRAIARRGAKH